MMLFRSLSLALLLASVSTAQLSGTYTINGLAPTGAGNYQTIADALTDLHSMTLMGPVVFWLFDDSGDWTESNPVVTFINGGTAPLSIQGQLITGASATNTVTFEAAPGEFPVLDATGQPFGVVMHGTQYVTVKGLEISNATSDGVSLYTDGASTPAGSTTGNLMGNQVIGCRIHDIGGCGINVYQNGGAAIAFDGTIIRNNFIWTCQMTNGGGNNAWRNGYINERRSINAVIENNTCYADTGVGPNFGVYCTDYAAPIGGPAASFRNNLIVKTVANGSPLRHLDAGSLPLLQDSNGYDDTSGGQLLLGLSGAAPDLITMQLMFPTLDPNGLSGPSALINPAIGDLHIGAGSIAIDTGAPIAAINDDIDGDPRPIGIGFDMGADESGANMPMVNLYGAGCMGANGIPSLSSGVLPFIGNSSFTVNVGSTTPGASTFIFAALGRQTPPIPVGGGCDIHLEITSFTALLNTGFGPFGPGIASSTGNFTFSFGIPNTPSLAGAIITLQAAVTDATAPLGFTLSNGLEAVIF